MYKKIANNGNDADWVKYNKINFKSDNDSYIPIKHYNFIANPIGGYKIGDQITTTRSGSTLTFDVVDFDNYKALDTTKHTMQLLMHDIVLYGTMSFSTPQLLYYAVNGLAIGNYKFTLYKAAYGGGTQYDGVYMFTLTQNIPAKGGFRHTNIGGYKSSYAQSDVIGNYLATYQPVNADGTGGEEIETVAVSVYDNVTECIDLGTFTAQDRSIMTDDGYHNSIERNAYGSNRYKDSVYRQWLNSNTASNFWKPQTIFDRVPRGSTMAGFLYGLSQDFINKLGEVEVKTVLHPFDRVDGATFDITYDKVYLLSRKDIYGIDEFSGLSEGTQLEYYQGTGNAEKIKYQNGTARYWWLRTPSSGRAGNARVVNIDGSLGSDGAYVAYGVVPACSFLGKGTFRKVEFR